MDEHYIHAQICYPKVLDFGGEAAMGTDEALRNVSVESGAGWVPYILEALEYMSVEASLPYEVPPSEVFRRQIYACTFFERRNLVDTVRQVGADNILFETDFPHPSCLFPDSLDYAVDALAELMWEERFKNFSGNAAKLYNIDIA